MWGNKHSPALLLEILRLMPNIESVDLDPITILRWPGSKPYPVPPLKLTKLRLHALEFDPDCMYYDLFRLFEVDWLQCYENHTAQGASSGLDTQELRTLDIQPYYGESSVRYAGQMLKRYSRSIPHVLHNICFDVSEEQRQAIYDDAAREQQDEVFAEAYSSVISFASTTLRELTLDLFEAEELAAFERIAPRIAPLITAAIARFTSLERLVLVVK
ncbi:hypothetical protein C8Q74DRAFT_1368803 [Fomes fomentarius]|nr:hypothetical protein C8Q74DRAFT_1368803 [Fomes fomentarius]